MVAAPMSGRRWVQEPLLTLPVFFLLLVGAAMVCSATLLCEGGSAGLLTRHLFAMGVGALVSVFVAVLPMRVLNEFSFPLFALALLLLVVVLFAGELHGGARRWIEIGPLRFQPSEPAKLAFILFLADFLARKRCDLSRIGWLLGALAVILAPFLLILREPDLGTALAFPVIGGVMLFWAGLSPLVLGVLASPLITAGLASLRFLVRGASQPLWGLLWIPAVALGVVLLRRRGIQWLLVLLFALVQLGVALETPRIWQGLESYQRERVVAFLTPERDPAGAGYQVIQSKIAIGSGCTLGRGFGRGSQKALSFLPRQHTDFIYSVVGEEWGFLGAGVVLLLYTLFLLRGIALARQVRSRFGSLVAIGVVALIFYHVTINIAMTLGLAPVTGLPLPFLSFGGSFLVVSMVAAGLLLGVGVRRHEY
ncbi:MAG: rod shape-determining protein RodA [Candidatus Eisenbacteria sp.]|nr:rod shape-determining protein RodA [Candidatus Eisenbacteria bacterium]